jgi:hypothetical protein
MMEEPSCLNSKLAITSKESARSSPNILRSGIVTRVIPNQRGHHLFNEYEVNFGNQVIALFYETQLRLVEWPENST